jgi:hypothetical protein
MSYSKFKGIGKYVYFIITTVSAESTLKVESKSAVVTIVSIIVGTVSIERLRGPTLSGIVSQWG